MKGTVLGGGCEEVSIVSIVYPRGTVSFSSLGYFSYVGSFSKHPHPSFALSISEHTKFKSI